MNKELLKLLNDINAKKAEVKNLVNDGKIEEAKAAKAELQTMQGKFDVLKDIEETETQDVVEKVEKQPVEKKNAWKEFADAARSRFRNSMNEATGTDGGYTVPEDIQTAINEYREAKASLVDLVDVETVSTLKGSRVFKARSQQTGFTKVGEASKIPAGSTPQFEKIEYEIEKYAGYLPVTNELLADSDANITSVLTKWIADESRVTRNKLILAAVNTQKATELKDLDGIKKALNVTLGQAFKATSKIITNDDGLNYLDTLKDSDGHYLLQPSPVDPMQLYLCVGASAIPLVVVPNADLSSDTTTTSGKTKIPMIVGDLQEGIKFFDRQLTTITTSNVATAGSLNAFEEDLTIFRAIEREDCVVKDSGAFVNGTITI